MRTRKTIVALAAVLFVVTGMTGIVAAESVKILKDGAPPDVYTSSPFMLNNDGITSNNLDLKFYNYLSISPANQQHTLTLTIYPISGGAASDITITATERSGGASASGASPVTLIWNQDTAGSGGHDYIDVALVSDGLDEAKYQIHIEDVGYQSGVVMDSSLENKVVTNVPEFTTVAVPIATILGLLFLFNHRKHRKDRVEK